MRCAAQRGRVCCPHNMDGWAAYRRLRRLVRVAAAEAPFQPALHQVPQRRQHQVVERRDQEQFQHHEAFLDQHLGPPQQFVHADDAGDRGGLQQPVHAVAQRRDDHAQRLRPGHQAEDLRRDAGRAPAPPPAAPSAPTGCRRAGSPTDRRPRSARCRSARLPRPRSGCRTAAGRYRSPATAPAAACRGRSSSRRPRSRAARALRDSRNTAMPRPSSSPQTSDPAVSATEISAPCSR